MAWSEATHAEFPCSFRAAAACLLLCLHHLSTRDAPDPKQLRGKLAYWRSWPASACASSPIGRHAPNAGSAYGRFLPSVLVRRCFADCRILPRLILQQCLY